MKAIQKNSGWIIILLLSFFPAFLWWQAPSFAPRFGDFTGAMTSIGQLLGLIGAVMFALNLILSARFHFLEKYFGGLDGVYAKHNVLGQVAFIFLLFHPLFLLARYSAGSFAGAASFLSIGSYWPRNLGTLSLALMLVLIVLTLYLRPKYNIWKWTHKFLGFAFFMASMHVWLIPSDVSRYMPLRWYVLGISVIGLLAFAYRTLFGWLLVKKFKYTVLGVRALSDSITEITMRPVSERMIFTPGQFIFVSFSGKTIGGESHPFSITSGPDDQNISIIAKSLGDYTAKLSALLPGTPAKIEGPFGNFSYKNAKNKDQIWIAGGIGVTPFISMAKSLKIEDGYNIDLYYCVKNESEAVYLDLLKNISASLNGKFKVIPYYTDKEVRITADIIQKTTGRLTMNNDIFLCAPPAMIESLRKQFLFKKVKRKLIHSEEFSF